MHWHIVCDFDGTIALEDATDTLLTHFADPAWQDIEAEWKAGRIGSRDCMHRQVSLVRATRVEIDALADGLTIDPGFAAFVAACDHPDITLTVVSDGLDYVIRRVLAKHGLGHLPAQANRLEPVGSDRWRLGFPHAKDDCRSRAGNCKCGHATAARAVDDRAVLVIGDGTSDRCVAGAGAGAGAGAADFVFAKAGLRTWCRAEGIPHWGFDDFSQVPALLAALPADRKVLARLTASAAFA